LTGCREKPFACKNNQEAAEFAQRGFAVFVLACFKDQTG